MSGAVGEVCSSIQGGEYGLKSASVSAIGGAVAAELTGGDALEGALHGVLINQVNHAAHAVKEAVVLPTGQNVSSNDFP